MRLYISYLSENGKKIYGNSDMLTVEIYAQIIRREILMVDIRDEK